MGPDKKNITVLMGGWNQEREVSLLSGKCIIDSLKRLGYVPFPLDMPRCPRQFLSMLPPRTDVFFNALHGHEVEDGTLQGFLNLLNIPYTHSGVLASSIGMDKQRAKKIFINQGILCPPGDIYSVADVRKWHVMPPPYVVKPCNEGSSVGVVIVKIGDPPPILEGWHYGKDVLVETYIPGRELFVSIMGGKILGVVEINPKSGFYDYESKYTSGKTEYLCPAPIDSCIRKQAEDMSLKAFNSIGCRGVARTDIRYDPSRAEGEQLMMLEINTQPGFTPLSLVPMAAKEAGLSYDDLVQWQVNNAACDLDVL